MAYETVLIDVDDRGVATLALNRPKQHNALNKTMIHELHQAAKALGDDNDVRVVVLTGTGKSFCAGGDIGWFNDTLSLDREGRIAESRNLAEMLHALNNIPKPLIGRINGAAYGGGTGMVSVCDLAITENSAQFGLTEVRLGLIPANISPYVVARIGSAKARSVMLSGALFGATRALEIGLIDHVVQSIETLDTAVETIVSDHLEASLTAVAATKRLIAHVSAQDIESAKNYTSEALADAWETDDGREGISAFLEKRLPSWRSGK